MPRQPSPATLRNLGPRSEQLLASAGITTVAQLLKLGSVAAYACVQRVSGSV
ncbi:MAG: TfoX/Sxy family DNA transformation protein, partial [Betaproteobacteria bacterium]